MSIIEFFCGEKRGSRERLTAFMGGGESIFISAEEVVGFTGNRHVCVRKLFKVRGVSLFSRIVSRIVLLFSPSRVLKLGRNMSTFNHPRF